MLASKFSNGDLPLVPSPEHMNINLTSVYMNNTYHMPCKVKPMVNNTSF